MSDQPQYYRITDSLESLNVRIRLRKVRRAGSGTADLFAAYVCMMPDSGGGGLAVVGS